MNRLVTFALLVAVPGGLAACAKELSPRAAPTGPMSAAQPPVDPVTLQPTALPGVPPKPQQGSVDPPSPITPIATCVAPAAAITSVALTATGIALCLDDAHDCWTVDVSTNRWTPIAVLPLTDVGEPSITHSTAILDGETIRVCGADGLNCESVPAPTTLSGDRSQGAAASSDRQLVASWSDRALTVSDVKTGHTITTIKPWRTSAQMPAGIRGAHFIGVPLGGAREVLEVLSADSPISDQARLFDPRTGKPIGGVLGTVDKHRAQSIDELPPVAIAGTQWMFARFPMDQVVVHDVRTGARIKVIDLYDPIDRQRAGDAQPAPASVLVRSRDGGRVIAAPQAIGVFPPVAIDLATYKPTVLHPPMCP